MGENAKSGMLLVNQYKGYQILWSLYGTREMYMPHTLMTVHWFMQSQLLTLDSKS